MSAVWNSFCAVRSIDDPVPGLPKLSWPGLLRASSTNSASVLAGIEGLTTRHALIPDREADAFEILHRVPAGVLVQRRVDQRRGSRHQPGVAVGIAARDRRGADVAVGAGPRFDDDRLLPVAADLFGHGAGDDVDDAAGGVGHDDVDRPVRIIALRLRAARAEQHGDARGKPRAALIPLIVPLPMLIPHRSVRCVCLVGGSSRWRPAIGCCARGRGCAARIRARSARR